MNDIKMPQLSDSMEEGTILSWLIEDGQHVSEGDELVELETDKAAMTHESEASGILHIVAAEGDTVPVGELIARIGPSEGTDDAGKSDVSEPAVATASAGSDTSSANRGGATIPVGQIADDSDAAESDLDDHGSDSRILATPLAERIASAQGIDLATLRGSGPRGRITKINVLEAAGINSAASQTTQRTSVQTGTAPATMSDQERSLSGQTQGAKGEQNEIKMTRFQSVVASRVAESKATVPHYQVQTEVVMDAAIELRSGFKAIGDGSDAPSFNDMIVKSSALALREFPQANGSFETGKYILFDRINIGIAVAAEDTLVVPTIVDADQKTLARIKADSKRLAGSVRSGEVTPPELAGGTFTVSNLGMYGMTAIFPVINPPQAAILGVGAMRQVLRRGGGGEVVDSSELTLTLSCDHRILNGADASRFLFEIKENLEQPLKLVL